MNLKSIVFFIIFGGTCLYKGGVDVLNAYSFKNKPTLSIDQYLQQPISSGWLTLTDSFIDMNDAVSEGHNWSPRVAPVYSQSGARSQPRVLVLSTKGIRRFRTEGNHHEEAFISKRIKGNMNAAEITGMVLTPDELTTKAQVQVGTLFPDLQSNFIVLMVDAPIPEDKNGIVLLSSGLLILLLLGGYITVRISTSSARNKLAVDDGLKMPDWYKEESR